MTAWKKREAKAKVSSREQYETTMEDNTLGYYPNFPISLPRGIYEHDITSKKKSKGKKGRKKIEVPPNITPWTVHYFL